MRADSYHDVTLAAYEREQDRLSRESDWIADRSAELMEGDCNPDLPENFVEALANAKPSTLADLAEVLKSGDAQSLGKFLFGYVEDYWIQESEQLAEDQLIEEQEEADLYRAECAAYAQEPSFDWSPRGW